jgi:tRNA pseudouridine38-40 synthase
VTTFRLTLEYDGTEFEGWQRQAGEHRTVQAALEAGIERVTGSATRVEGSGRTDAGVHAWAQVASVRVDTRLDANALLRALNGVLPADVRVVDAAVASEAFHARYDARSKTYCYRLWNGRNYSPLRARFSHWVPPRLDLDAMDSAARVCEGRHDFASFQAAGSGVKGTVRTLSRARVTGTARGEIELWVEGDGFLRHMVRTLAGTVVEVGLGRRSPDSMAALLAARDRRKAGPTAPAAGLTLIRVVY